MKNTKADFKKPSELTEENYYSELGRLNNAEHPHTDIMTITAFMGSFQEKVAHYERNLQKGE